MTKLITRVRATVEADDEADRGAAVVDYGLVTALVGITLVAVTTLFGEQLAALL